MSITKENGSNLPAIFSYGENKKLTAIIIEGKHTFVAKDACDLLDIKNPSDALSRLDADEKLTSVVTRGSGKRTVNLVTESGLYNLIFQSRKPEARSITKWVTSEVLPALRKTGGFQIPSTGQFMTIDQRRLNKASEMSDLIYQGIVISGSAHKLCTRLQISAGTLSRIMNGDAKSFTEEMLNRIEKGCSMIVTNAGSQQSSMFSIEEQRILLNDVIMIEDARLRCSLANKIMGGGLL